MSARIRQTISFMMIVITVLSLICFLGVAAVGQIPLLENAPIISDIPPALGPIGAIISGIACLLIPFWARIMFNAKDELDYDEFGVKKQNKHYMDSQLRREIEARKREEMELALSEETVKRITHKGSSDPEKDLQKLIGLSEVKEKAADLNAKLEFLNSSKNKKQIKKDEYFHMAFLGRPGTGKTTVARIITGILYENYCIDENKIIEVDGNSLKGTTAKETALKTKALIRASYGGVLFIDEAYALMYDLGVGEVAIATLIKEMEDNRDKFTLILAGYTDEMRDLIQINPGFASRIKEYYHFEDYDNEECCRIFESFLADKGFKTDGNLSEKLCIRIDKERRSNTWGNGRTMRNLADEAAENHMIRFVREKLPKQDKYIITNEDIQTEVKNSIV